MREFLPQLNELIETYKASVTFVFVYIEEAHAIDEWPNPSVNSTVTQHKTIHDRLSAAKLFRSSFEIHKDCKIVLDNMNNDYNRILPSWPFRFYVIDKGLVLLKTMPEGIESDEVSLDQLIDWFEHSFQAR